MGREHRDGTGALRAEEFSHLLEVSQLIVSELDLGRVQELVAERAREIVGAESVIVPMLNPARDAYTYVAAAGQDAELVRGSSFPSHVGMCGWVLRNGRSLLFGETTTPWTDEATPWEAGQQSAVLVPLVGRKGIIGGLSALGKPGGGCFTRHDLDLLTLFANQVSVAVENAQLFQELSREVEERRAAERSARESRSFLRQILDTMPQSVFWKDRESIFLGCNKVFANAAGIRDPDEVIGKTDFDLPWPRFEAEAYRRDDQEVMSGDRAKLRIIEPLQRADGTRLWIDTSKVPLHGADGDVVGVLGVFADVTAAKEAEERLRASERLVRTILDTVDEGLVVVGRDLRIQVANRAFAAMVSCPPDAVAGRLCYAVARGLDRPCFELGEPCAVSDVFAEESPASAGYRSDGGDGRPRFVETKAYPLRDAEGRVTAAIELVIDTTERHQLDEERVRAQKLEAVGTLAGGIAHDFNNLLQGVFGLVSLVRLQLDDPPRACATLAEIEQALRQSVKLTNQLLTFAKGGRPAKKTIDLAALVHAAARLTLSGSAASSRVTADEQLWSVEADEGQIHQVIQNIVLNAVQAMPRGGQVAITLRNVRAPGPDVPRELAAGPYVRVDFTDTGGGIPERDLPRIFEPYFTTKERGSGLGLATAYSIVRNHGGALAVAATSRAGTTLTLHLPANAEARRAAPPAPEAARAARTARVLVMDDEPVILSVTDRLLRRLGHRTELASHGEEAVAKYEVALRTAEPFDVAILDVTIRGGMGGVETAKRLLALHPGARVVLSSGYSEEAGTDAPGVKAFLKKPYDLVELRETLVRVLEP